MRNVFLMAVAGSCFGLVTMTINAAELPAITGKPVIDRPPVLEWPADRVLDGPNLTELTANGANDVHGRMDNCDLAVSTAGNYHMALRELWDAFREQHSSELKTWAYTTSPPVAVEQVKAGRVVFGNLEVGCRPQVVVAPKRVIDKLVADGQTDSVPVEVFQNLGNVILVRKGNPKRIHRIWDLGRRDVRVVTPNPEGEKGAFGNYAETLYQVAAQDPRPPKGMTAQMLFDRVYNGATGRHDKWLAGSRIHHREVPWSIAYGRGDASVIFYHLALYMVRTFPDKFEIVPLGGTADAPVPAPGNVVGRHYAVAVKGDWSQKQERLRDRFLHSLAATDFSNVLARHGMKGPNGTTGVLASEVRPGAVAKN